MIDCPKCNRRGAEFDPRCKQFIRLFSDCNHSWKQPEPSPLDTLLAMLKPLVWEDVFASDGELRVHVYSFATCAFGEFYVYSKDIYFAVTGTKRPIKIGDCSGIADGKSKVDEQEFPSRVRALFEG